MAYFSMLGDPTSFPRLPTFPSTPEAGGQWSTGRSGGDIASFASAHGATCIEVQASP